MEVRFRLEQVVQQYAPAKVKPRGLYREIENWDRARSAKAGSRILLERHKLSRLCKNEPASISLNFLNALCEYLIQECGVPEHVLPQQLFGTKEERVLDLFAATERLQFLLGVRESREWGPNNYVIATDAKLQGLIASQVSQHLAIRSRKFLKSLDTVLLDAPPRTVKASTNSKNWQRIKQSSAEYYRRFCGSKNASMVATGSTKVNCVVEQVFSATFGDEAHRPPAIETPQQRKVPIYIRYRDSDPQPSSCFGGLSLRKREAMTEPGIYYEGEDGGWQCLPCDDNQADAAAVLYKYDVKPKRMSLVCSGFSSRATHYLSDCFDKILDELWPPQVETDELILGVFLVRFAAKEVRKQDHGARVPALEHLDVIRVADNVIKSRLAKQAKP